MKKLFIMCCLLTILVGCTSHHTNEELSESVISSVTKVDIHKPIETQEYSPIIIYTSTPEPTPSIVTQSPVQTTTPTIFTITAYDLSIESCGKSMKHHGYGITSRGDSLKNKSREEAMAVAVDPKVIPLGTLLSIEFIDESYKQYDGIYIAIDTGSAVKNKIIDLFMGDFKSHKTHPTVDNFGSTKAKVTIIEERE